MKINFTPVLSLMLFMAAGCSSSGTTMEVKNTYQIEPGDSKEIIVEKAAHVVPTANQLKALEDEFIAFVHFGPNTFTRMEWGNGMEDPKIFDLKELDTDQWCEAMKAGGMTKVLLTVKHHDGFVLWQSRYTDHGIMSTGFQDGKGDILKDLSASCVKYGLKLGVYLSPADLFHIEQPDGLYGNLSKYTVREIPRQIEGRPFKNKTTFKFEVDDYNEYFLNQLFEILTEYGPVHEVWFDGAHPKRKGDQTYNYKAWKELIHTVAPEAVVFGREDIRWCGNEAGGTRDAEWNIVGYQEDPNTTTNFPDMTADNIGSREELYKAAYLHYQPTETNTSIREGWFYRDDTHQKVRSADDVFDIYERSVGGNSIFLLNIPPNREGRFSDADVNSLRETGKRIRETYGVNLLADAKGPKEVLDSNSNTYQLLEGDVKEILISTANEVTINRIVLQEAIATHSERVEKHAVDAWVNGEWKEIAQAANIGYKRILRFQEVTTNKLRVRILESRMSPAISHISAHYYQSRPPQLTYNRTTDGKVTIEPMKQDFNWKPHGEDVAGNLNAGYSIHYTTDGSAPTEQSTQFESPFVMDAGTLKAVAVLKGEAGPTLNEQVGYIKSDWKVIRVSSEVENRYGTNTIDESDQTFWLSKESKNNAFIDIDLGKTQLLHGFAYTPVTNANKSMMAKGYIKVSNDGKKWNTVEVFNFGNLINDPSKRYHHFKTNVKSRFVRIEASEVANSGTSIAIAELNFF